MIRYYAYYNHGGYKDFYVGNTKEEVTSIFFTLVGSSWAIFGRESKRWSVKGTDRTPKTIA